MSAFRIQIYAMDYLSLGYLRQGLCTGGLLWFQLGVARAEEDLYTTISLFPLSRTLYTKPSLRLFFRLSLVLPYVLLRIEEEPGRRAGESVMDEELGWAALHDLGRAI